MVVKDKNRHKHTEKGMRVYQQYLDHLWQVGLKRQGADAGLEGLIFVFPFVRQLERSSGHKNKLCL